MTFTRPSFLYLAGLLSLGILTACAPSFTTQSILEERIADRANNAVDAPQAAISRLQVNSASDQKLYDNSARELRHSFANAIFNSGRYAQVWDSLPAAPLPIGLQSFDVVITPRFHQEIRWLWYLGVLTGLGPLWPALPRDGSLELQLDLNIAKGGVVQQRLSMTERDTFDLFWYGAYRVWDLQTQSDFLYRKLLGRLTSMLADQAPTQQYSRPDASGMVEEETVTSNTSSITATSIPPKSISIAIMEPECNGIDSLTALTLNAKLRTELFSLGKFQIVERERMHEILAEQGLQQSGACSGTACYVQMGQLAGVDRIFVASYGKVGQRYFLTLRALAVGTGSVLEESTTELEGSPEALLTQGIPDLVHKLRLERITQQ